MSLAVICPSEKQSCVITYLCELMTKRIVELKELE